MQLINMKLKIDFSNGEVSLSESVIAATDWKTADVELAIGHFGFYKISEKKSLFFRKNEHISWHSFEIDSLIIECAFQKCTGCIINLNPKVTFDQVRGVISEKFEKIGTQPSGIKTDGNKSIKYKFRWGSVKLIHDSHYGASTICLEYA
jgi:hypothetical protein